MTVAVVIEERASGIPTFQASVCPRSDSGFFGDIGKCSVAVVVIKGAIAPVGDKQVVVTVVIVIAYANALPPAGARKTGLDSDIRKSTVSIVLVESICGLLAFRILRVETGTVHEKDVEPTVVVVIEEGGAAAGGLE